MSRRPRIAWICNSAVGVSETFLVDNLRAMREWADVPAFCGNPCQGSTLEQTQYLDFDAVPQRIWHAIGRKMTGLNVWIRSKQTKAKSQLAGELKSFRPDVIWIEFGTTAHVLEPLLQELEVPYIINVHGFDITRALAISGYKDAFIRLANRSAAVICASHHTVNLCQSLGVKEGRCQMIRLALDGQAIQPDVELEKTEHPSFVHLGRLTPKKAPRVTLASFEQVVRQMPDAKMTFIGSGPEEQALRAEIMAKNLEEQVEIIDALPRSEALKKVQSHWVFCQHSVTASDGDQEGFALSPAEAALLEMPVISTFHNGIPEHVIHQETGILVEEWDVQGMAAAMIQLTQDSYRLTTMGKAGRQNILDMCNPTKRQDALQTLVADFDSWTK